uniref:Prohibitin family protein n=1 Tax=candidate division WOR-3 bacterium TaxID=2052148 RepID=A0A7C4YGG9_UNCW3
MLFFFIITLIAGIFLFITGIFRFRTLSYILFGISFIFLILSAVRIVGPGEVGVQVLFGRVKENILRSGLHFVNPLISVVRMNVRTQVYTMSKVPTEGAVGRDDAITSLTKEGLSVDLDVSVWFHLEPEKAAIVYRDIGIDYVATIVRPAIRTAIRNATAYYLVSEIYSEKREQFVKDITELLKKDLEVRGIFVENVLLRNIQLPQKVKNAIDEKIAAEQEAQKMQFVLIKEEKEAERRRIEAEGIARAQRIIANSLTNQYLQWYYIQTMKELVNSPNNTVVILPFDQRLTPLIQIPTQQNK